MFATAGAKAAGAALADGGQGERPPADLEAELCELSVSIAAAQGRLAGLFGEFMARKGPGGVGSDTGAVGGVEAGVGHL